MSYVIHKIKFDGLGLKIKFDEYNEGRVKACDIGFSEPPKPSFSDTFSRLILVAHEVMGIARIKVIDDRNGIILIRCNGIEFKQKSDGTKALCAYLCSFTSVGYTWLPDIKIMCSELNISRNEFYKYRAELIEHGYIEIENEDNNE